MPAIHPSSFADLHKGHNQYIIPPYQRTITWPENQWEALFEDVLAIAEEPQKKHLFQIFQFKATNTHHHAVEVGDGQQRLVQTSLLLAALAYKIEEISRDRSLPDNSISELKDMQRKILPFSEDLKEGGILSFVIKGNREPRIKVARNNLQTYESIILWNELRVSAYKDYRDDNIVIAAFKYYLSSLGNHLTEKSINEKIVDMKSIIHALMEQFIFAVTYFDKEEDMQASYEATNSRGVPLTDSELIKNHIFQEFDLKNQYDLVSNFWIGYDEDSYWIDKPALRKNPPKNTSTEENFSKGNLDLFFKYDIISRDISFLSMSSAYSVFQSFKMYHQDYFSKNPSASKKDYYRRYLSDLDKYSKIYEKFTIRSEKTNPSYRENTNALKNSIESDVDRRNRVHSFTEKENKWWNFYHRIAIGCKEKDAAIVLLLAILRAGENDEIIIDELMSIVESYYIRKVLVNGNCKYGLELFIPLISAGLTPEEIKSRVLLKSDKRNRWESDEMVLHHLKTMQYKNHNRLFTILNIDYENSQKNVKRTYGQVIEYRNQSLEHFMPQNPNSEDGWPIILPDNLTRDDLTYNFGNFILLPGKVNTEIGNWSYAKKVEHFKKDVNETGTLGLVSVDKILSLGKWGYEEILNSCAKKGEAILKKYQGPLLTIVPSWVKEQLDQSRIRVNQKVFIDLVNGDTQVVGVVSAQGYILAKDGRKFHNLQEIKAAFYPGFSEKQKQLRYED